MLEIAITRHSVQRQAQSTGLSGTSDIPLCIHRCRCIRVVSILFWGRFLAAPQGLRYITHCMPGVKKSLEKSWTPMSCFATVSLIWSRKQFPISGEHSRVRVTMFMKELSFTLVEGYGIRVVGRVVTRISLLHAHAKMTIKVQPADAVGKVSLGAIDDEPKCRSLALW